MTCMVMNILATYNFKTFVHHALWFVSDNLNMSWEKLKKTLFIFKLQLNLNMNTCFRQCCGSVAFLDPLTNGSDFVFSSGSCYFRQ
jgi:hypothetical protein